MARSSTDTPIREYISRCDNKGGCYALIHTLSRSSRADKSAYSEQSLPDVCELSRRTRRKKDQNQYSVDKTRANGLTSCDAYVEMCMTGSLGFGRLGQPPHHTANKSVDRLLKTSLLLLGGYSLRDGRHSVLQLGHECIDLCRGIGLHLLDWCLMSESGDASEDGSRKEFGCSPDAGSTSLDRL